MLHLLEKYSLHNYDVIDSTSLEAKRFIKKNIYGNHIIWALKQNNGYGKLSRKWESSNEDISFSLIIEHQYLEKTICQILFVASISVRQIIEKIFLENKIKAKIEVKWPNDIMVNGKKICGIMIETLSSPEGRSFIVIGIGINIMDNSSNEDLSISSLIEYNIHNVNIENIIKDIVINFENHKKTWSKDGFIPIKELWMKHAYNLGSKIYVKNNGTSISGIFTGINDAGSINLLLESGLTDSISIGDVFFNR